MEEYLDTLGRAKESVADVLFCLQVRLQALAQQVSEEKDQRQLERYQTIANLTPGNSTEPLLNRWYLEAVQRKIHEITALIPPHLKSNGKFLSLDYSQPYVDQALLTGGLYRNTPVTTLLHLP